MRRNDFIANKPEKETSEKNDNRNIVAEHKPVYGRPFVLNEPFSIEDGIAGLKDIESQEKSKGYFDVKLKLTVGQDYDDDYNFNVYVYSSRYETDVEYNRRMVREEKAKVRSAVQKEKNRLKKIEEKKNKVENEKRLLAELIDKYGTELQCEVGGFKIMDTITEHKCGRCGGFLLKGGINGQDLLVHKCADIFNPDGTPKPENPWSEENLSLLGAHYE